LGTDPNPVFTGRVLALDVGKRRIGLAVSDELGITAIGIPTLQRTRIRADVRQLKEVVEQRNVATLLVGKPLHMSGDESRQSEYIREFAERLAEYVERPVIYWDERLTSAEAERLMREDGASLERRKKAVDQLAAILLLQSYLQNRLIAIGEESSG